MSFFIISSSLLLSLLFLLYYVHKHDWSVPLIGALRRRYFQLKFKISNLDKNPEKNLSKFFLVIKLRTYYILISLFETSTISFDVVKEDLYKNFKNQITNRHKLSMEEREDLKWVEDILTEIEDGKGANLSRVELLYEQLFKIHKLEKQRIRKYSLYGVLLLIFANVFTTIAFVIMFPHIFSSKAAETNKIVFDTKELWKEDANYNGIDLFSEPGVIKLPSFSTISDHSNNKDFVEGDFDNLVLDENDNLKLKIYDSLNTYHLSGVYISKVIDAKEQTKWNNLSAVYEIPKNTSVTIETRTKVKKIEDSKENINHGWSPWQKVENSKIISPKGRYIQYRIHLITTDDNLTPVVKSITLLQGKKYAKKGEYISKIINSETDLVDWTIIEREMEKPENTDIIFYMRSGLNKEIDSSWSEWIELDCDLIDIPDYQYLQFKIILKTDDITSTPVLRNLKINYFDNSKI